ncbi:ABC transporter ATPase, partial [Flavobacteriaceae bacterium]|nr:ABC transporter ATPase [Flavobacteriaceae bacterium]
MIVDFDVISNESRVWIYQSNRTLSPKEITEIELKIKNFLISWTAHGSDLETSFIIKYSRFIIISLNESFNMATGCSIDSSVRFIQELEKQYSISLLDKMNVSYRHGEFIAYKPLIEFK